MTLLRPAHHDNDIPIPIRGLIPLNLAVGITVRENPLHAQGDIAAETADGVAGGVDATDVRGARVAEFDVLVRVGRQDALGVAERGQTVEAGDHVVDIGRVAVAAPTKRVEVRDRDVEVCEGGRRGFW